MSDSAPPPPPPNEPTGTGPTGPAGPPPAQPAGPPPGQPATPPPADPTGQPGYQPAATGSSGMSGDQMKEAFSSAHKYDLGIMGAGVLMFIWSLLPYYTVSANFAGFNQSDSGTA